MNTERLELLQGIDPREREAFMHYQTIEDNYIELALDYDQGLYDEPAALPISDLERRVVKALYYFGILTEDMDTDNMTEADIIADISELINNN